MEISLLHISFWRKVSLLCLYRFYTIYGIHTVLVSLHSQGIWLGPIAHWCPSQDPNLVFSPPLELIHNKLGRVQFHRVRFSVRSTFLDEEYLIVDDPSVRAVLWRWTPATLDCGRTCRIAKNVFWRCSWYYWIWNFHTKRVFDYYQFVE